MTSLDDVCRRRLSEENPLVEDSVDLHGADDRVAKVIRVSVSCTDRFVAMAIIIVRLKSRVEKSGD